MLNRRDILQIGGSSFFGLGLSGVLGRQQAAAALHHPPRVKSVVLVFLPGGGSQIDMWDPKPEASEAKGEFGAISTKLAGIQFSDKMAKMAERADMVSVVRSMHHGDNRHLSGSHNALTGYVQPFTGNSNQDKSLKRSDWPCYGGGVSLLRPRADGLPSQVTVPNPLIEGALVWPGQHSGFLGPKHDPFVLNSDPNTKDYKVNDLSLLDGLSFSRLDDRRKLLRTIDERQQGIEQSPQGIKYTSEQQAAFSMLSSKQLKGALDVNAESDKVRDRYGRHKYGQTLLLARRLVEMEIPVIQASMGHVQMSDTHVNHFPRLRTMLPALDNGLSALLDDLKDRGLLDTTLVVCVGEFGRTPSISPLPNQKVPGRHHWAAVYSALFAGGGTRPGQIIGASDNIGGHPITTPYHPNDMGATIYDSLGINPATLIEDRLGRPVHLNTGSVMDVLYNGVA